MANRKIGSSSSWGYQRVDYIDGSLADLFYDYCNLYGLDNVDLLPDDIQAFPKGDDDE